MWIIMTWQCISPEVIVKGFKKCCIASVLDKPDHDMLCMTVKRIGMLGGIVRKMKALNLKIEAATLIDKGRQNPT